MEREKEADEKEKMKPTGKKGDDPGKTIGEE